MSAPDERRWFLAGLFLTTLAALSLSGPAFRMTEERLLAEIVPLVTGAAERLSREMGFDSPTP